MILYNTKEKKATKTLKTNGKSTVKWISLPKLTKLCVKLFEKRCKIASVNVYKKDESGTLQGVWISAERRLRNI